jgi:hypothetical protein
MSKHKITVARLLLQEEKGRQRETNYEQLGDIVLEWEKETSHSSEWDRSDENDAMRSGHL